jgi:hypothetical protein
LYWSVVIVAGTSGFSRTSKDETGSSNSRKRKLEPLASARRFTREDCAIHGGLAFRYKLQIIAPQKGNTAGIGMPERRHCGSELPAASDEFAIVRHAAVTASEAIASYGHNA